MDFIMEGICPEDFAEVPQQAALPEHSAENNGILADSEQSRKVQKMSDSEKPKEIRFIDSHYNELFKIPDGGYITLNYADGEQAVRRCKYHGETHVDVGINLYHICEFAEKMEANGTTYQPCPEPEVVRGYVITDRTPVKDKVFVMGHNPKAHLPFVTWQGYNDRPDKDFGHYFDNRWDTRTDLLLRSDAERLGLPYKPASAKYIDEAVAAKPTIGQRLQDGKKKSAAQSAQSQKAKEPVKRGKKKNMEVE
jgi:hypothetical protein